MLSVDCPGATDDNRTASGWERSSAKGRGPCASVAAHQSHYVGRTPSQSCDFERAVFCGTLYFMDDLQARTQKELADIVSILTELTGLPSRWSGRVELVPDAEFKGRKRQMCDIRIDAALAAQDERWPTLVLESLHSISAGYNANDFRDFRGWEEGVVEKLQQIYRPIILERLGIKIADSTFLAEGLHNFNAYIAALESLRLLRKDSISPDETPEEFYLGLLRLPIKDRPDVIVGVCFEMQPPQRGVFVAAFSKANSVLKTRIN